MAGVREYRSALRGAQQEQTRVRILEAAIGQIADEGLSELTVPLVAERAGVAVRTVYRHFPTKEELLDGVNAFRDQKFGFVAAESVEELLEIVPRLFSGFAAHHDLARAADATAAGRQIHDRARRRRAQALSGLFEDVTRDLPPEQARQVVATIQVLWSTRAWLTLHDNWDMDGEQAGAAVQWAMGALIAEARRMAAAASRGPQAEQGRESR
jgi:AcrR family transcriptional regulator